MNLYKGTRYDNTIKYFKISDNIKWNRTWVDVLDIQTGSHIVVNNNDWKLERIVHFKFNPSTRPDYKAVVDIVWSPVLSNYIVITTDEFLQNYPIVLDGSSTGKHEYLRTVMHNPYLLNRVVIDGRAYVKGTVNNLNRLPNCVRGVSNIVIGDVYREVYGNEAMRGTMSDPFVVTGVGFQEFNYTSLKRFQFGGYHKGQMNFKDLGIVPVRVDPDGVEVYNCNGLLAV